MPTPINTECLYINIIGAIPFACILQDRTLTYQLQIMPALPEEHLHAGTTLPLEQKTKGQILHEVVPPEYHEFTDVFSEGSAKELPHINLTIIKLISKKAPSSLSARSKTWLEIKLWALKDYLANMLSKSFICSLISAAGALVLFAKKKDGSPDCSRT
ncbi:hypothetical protein C0989_002400 [Termitomyces sp. Mn162]|nr:hypothetical protein C0989_002400 [Termitomyces sp. Mn162]